MRSTKWTFIFVTLNVDTVDLFVQDRRKFLVYKCEEFPVTICCEFAYLIRPGVNLLQT
jgi:hypothetical protein